jgi:allantoicase
VDTGHGFGALPDLAVRTLGGSVVWASDEAFAERQNLILPYAARFDPGAFGHRGKVYDGWETRRRRGPGHDEAIVRLGVPGLVHGVVIDTSWFKGNAPAEASVEAACVSGYPSAEDLASQAQWMVIVPRSPVNPDCANVFPASTTHRWTHVRLSIYPDGGVARLRVHGEPVPDPWLLDVGCPDLAALENGGMITGCSNRFYSSPGNLIAPGRAAGMSDGWETARRRNRGNDWVAVRLAAAGTPRIAELDTSYFLHNAPGMAQLRGCRLQPGECPGEDGWFSLLERTRLQPDTRHRFPLGDVAPATHVRLDIYPDGGLARLRLFGVPTSAGREAAGLHWFNTLPPGAAIEAAATAGELPAEAAETLAARRPLSGISGLPPGLRQLVAGDARGARHSTA